MKKIIFILFIITVIINCSGISSGNIVIKETNEITNFNSVSISHGINLKITQDDNYNIKIKSDDNVIDSIKVVKQGTMLKIYREPTKYYRNATMEVYVNMPELIRIDGCSGSDTIILMDKKDKNFEANISSGAIIRGEINYKNTKINLSSGSQAIIRGETNNLELNVSSGSQAKLSQFITEYTKANLSSGSEVDIYTKKLTANLSSGSTINYYYELMILDSINLSSGSKLNKID